MEDKIVENGNIKIDKDESKSVNQTKHFKPCCRREFHLEPTI